MNLRTARKILGRREYGNVGLVLKAFQKFSGGRLVYSKISGLVYCVRQRFIYTGWT